MKTKKVYFITKRTTFSQQKVFHLTMYYNGDCWTNSPHYAIMFTTKDAALRMKKRLEEIHGQLFVIEWEATFNLHFINTAYK